MSVSVTRRVLKSTRNQLLGNLSNGFASNHFAGPRRSHEKRRFRFNSNVLGAIPYATQSITGFGGSTGGFRICSGGIRISGLSGGLGGKKSGGSLIWLPGIGPIRSFGGAFGGRGIGSGILAPFLTHQL